MSVLRNVAPLALVVMLGCSQQQPAQIVFKGNQHFNQSPQITVASAYETKVSGAFTGASDSAYLYPNAQPIISPAVMAAPISSIQVQEIVSPKPIQVSEVAELDASQPVKNSMLPENLFAADTRAVQLGTAKLRPAPTVSENALPMKALTKVESPVSSPVSAITEMASSLSLTNSSSAHFSWPVHGEVISNFGEKKNGQFNDGINIAAPAGTPVKSVGDGVVVYAGNELKGYGNMVIVRHDNGWMSAYAHADELWAQPDDVVRQGDKIATVGATGSVELSQLHFGLRKGRDAVDPTSYLARNVAAIQ